MTDRTVALETPLGELVGRSLVVEAVALGANPTDATVERCAVGLWVRPGRRGSSSCRIVGDPIGVPPARERWRLPAPGTVFAHRQPVTMPAVTAVGTAATAVCEVTPCSAMVWELEAPWVRSRIIASTLVMTTLAAVLFFLFVVPWFPGVSFAIILATVTGLHLFPETRPVRLRRGHRILELDAALQRIDAAVSGPTPSERVQVVQERYGALLTDAVYRIENSALFDAAVPSTQRFQVALATWDPDAPDAVGLASQIETTFQNAREDAERLGFDHLPQVARSPARRAVKAITLGLAAPPGPEREVALKGASTTLKELALYYLPVIDPAAPTLIATRKELP